MNQYISKLNNQIVKCNKCERLVKFRKKIAFKKRKQFIDEIYWGKPVTGFGDTNAQILLLGLAPAAHGGNRTGRVFTGDKSAEFLFKCLYNSKHSNQPNSDHVNVGLKLINIYITLVLKCVPPFDKPTNEELKNCYLYLEKEILNLKKLKQILCLGKVAFDFCVNFFNLNKKETIFKHGSTYKINKRLTLISSYHPSPRNENTGRLNESMMTELLVKLNKR